MRSPVRFTGDLQPAPAGPAGPAAREPTLLSSVHDLLRARLADKAPGAVYGVVATSFADHSPLPLSHLSRGHLSSHPSLRIMLHHPAITYPFSPWICVRKEALKLQTRLLTVNFVPPPPASPETSHLDQSRNYRAQNPCDTSKEKHGIPIKHVENGLGSCGRQLPSGLPTIFEGLDREIWHLYEVHEECYPGIHPTSLDLEPRSSHNRENHVGN